MNEPKASLLSRGYLHTSFMPLLVLLMLISLPNQVKAQPAPIPFHEKIYILDSGMHDGNSSGTVLAFSHILRIQDAAWLQIHLSSYDLGEQSYVAFTSEMDGARGIFYSDHLSLQGNYSAYFNGDAVRIDLYVAPGESDIYFNVEKVIVGDWISNTSEEELILKICGPDDDRVSSDDPAAGRILNAGCTGWIVSNEAYLAAGHCVWYGLNMLEFNVPPSLEDGTIQHPGPEDQYTIDANSIEYNVGGIGDDWCVFDCFANAQTGYFAWEVQDAFYRMSKDDEADDITITGFGLDNEPPGPSPPDYRNSDSQTQQTHTGPLHSLTGTMIKYFVDTMGGNSGSPVINPDITVGLADGIHTHGGCDRDDPPTTPNLGTRFNNQALGSAIHDFQQEESNDVEYVDKLHPGSLQDGSVLRPWDTVAAGVSEVQSNGRVCIVEGHYYEQNIVITQSMTLKATCGSVIIGE